MSNPYDFEYDPSNSATKPTPSMAAAQALARHLGGLREWTATDIEMVARIIDRAYWLQKEGDQWCAACGQWGDHSSGTCPTIPHPH